jgi:hypothetical protein
MIEQQAYSHASVSLAARLMPASSPPLVLALILGLVYSVAQVLLLWRVLVVVLVLLTVCFESVLVQ